MANRAYKFRMYPNDKQKILFAKTFGCVRMVYNHWLDRKIIYDTRPQAQDDSIVRMLNVCYYLNLLYFNFYYLTKDIIL